MSCPNFIRKATMIPLSKSSFKVSQALEDIRRSFFIASSVRSDSLEPPVDGICKLQLFKGIAYRILYEVFDSFYVAPKGPLQLGCRVPG